MTARPALVYLTESEARSSLTMPEAISLAERGIEPTQWAMLPETSSTWQ